MTNNHTAAAELAAIRDRITNAEARTHITAAITALTDFEHLDDKPATEHRQAPPHRSRSRIAGALDNAGTSTDGVTVGRTRRNRST